MLATSKQEPQSARDQLSETHSGIAPMSATAHDVLSCEVGPVCISPPMHALIDCKWLLGCLCMSILMVQIGFKKKDCNWISDAL